MLNARFRLASLWLSQVARPVADWGLRLLVVRHLLLDDATRNFGWHLATAVFVAPFILLSPLNGAISNGLPKRWVLVGSCAVSLAALLVQSALTVPSLTCLAIVAACTAVYSPTRYALLPAAAQDTHWSLARINSWIEMGGAAGIVIGLLAGQQPQAEWIVVGAAAVALAAALPAWFVSDLRRPEPPLSAIRDFFEDCLRIFRSVQPRVALLVLACFLGVLTAGSGAVFTQSFDPESGVVDPVILILITIGAAAGALLAGWQKHLHRGLGLVPLGSAGLMLSFAWASATGAPSWLACFLMGLTGGLVSVPLRAAYQATVPPDARGNAMAVSNMANHFVMAAVAGVLFLLVRLGVFRDLAQQLFFLTLVGIVGTLVLFWVLLRPLVELLFGLLIWPFFRVQVAGLGLEEFPAHGPVLVLANHACWFDPVLVGKVLPRRLFPMMTSVFFDLPIMHWMMVNVVGAIRVQATGFRREAPELEKAIALLDRDECVLIFPEGMMRRKEEQILRHFGQGIWRILRDRPDTPVVACWIEGNWGSYTSYKGGLPRQNKKLDWWRPIRVGVQAPRVVPAEVLEDQRATRAWLMRACLEARRHLGLEVPEQPAITSDEESSSTEQ